VLNSLKHAFKGGRDNTISITLKKTPDQRILLVVADNGIGLPANITISSPRTLGLSLIVSLSGQLNGTISMGNKNGTRFQIIFEG
jgi:two-component sensor histidine kinase